MLAANIRASWLGLIFIQFFAVRLGLFPVAGCRRSRRLAGRAPRPSRSCPRPCSRIVNSALITRFTRASMLDVLG